MSIQLNVKKLVECTNCEGTGMIYVGFENDDIKPCDKCEDGYIEY